MCTQAYISYVFDYFIDIFAARAYHIMKADSGCLHNSGWDGKAKDISQT